MDEYEVFISKKALKGIEKLPEKERNTLVKLIKDLKVSGPIQPGYRTTALWAVIDITAI